MTAARQRLGAMGEERAAAWYRAAGYQVLAQNWRCREGEIDLILAHGRRVVICEVKTRTSLAYGHPAEAVGPVKQRRLRVLAGRWLADSGLSWRPSEVRFDVAAVLPDRIEVIESAF